MIQKEAGEDESYLPIIILTHQVVESAMNQAIEAIEALDTVRSPVTRIRVESLAG